MAEDEGTPTPQPGKSKPWTHREFGGKTVWDWMDLLIVPIVISLITVVFTVVQEDRQQRIENQRAEAERELAEERAQDEAQQAYFDQMNQLLLDRNLREAEEDSEVRTLARVRTLTMLERLDSSRKTQILRFLSEANLVQSVDGRGPVIVLKGADLEGVNLSSNVSLQTESGWFTPNVAYLNGADLSYANLSHANLRAAKLHGADLSYANLTEADLSRVNLTDLGRTDLSGTDLSDANLRGANLTGADLSSADLSEAEGIARDKLEQQAKSLEGATMPDGKLHAGEYATDDFEPALSFRVGDGWQLSYFETTDELSLVGPEGGQLIFTSPHQVFDPSTPSEPKEIPGPDNADEWVSWFQSHPNLDTSTPIPMSVGGVSGMRIDVTSSSTLENYPRDLCSDQPCVPLYHPGVLGSQGWEATIYAFQGWEDWFIIVDVGGEPVVIDVSAPADKLEEFRPKAQKVLDTVEWKGG